MRGFDSRSGLCMGLEDQILKLPINPFEKVGLALVHLEEKPATELFVNVEGVDVQKVESLLIDTDISFKKIDKVFGSTRRIIFLIGKSKDDVEELHKIWIDQSKRAFRETHLALGRLYGFPEATVVKYAAGGEMASKDEEGVYKTTDWWPYLSYITGKGRVGEDSSAAKRWWIAIKTKFPLLDEEFQEWARKED